jgi:hypothetical protein
MPPEWRWARITVRWARRHEQPYNALRIDARRRRHGQPERITITTMSANPHRRYNRTELKPSWQTSVNKVAADGAHSLHYQGRIPFHREHGALESRTRTDKHVREELNGAAITDRSTRSGQSATSSGAKTRQLGWAPHEWRSDDETITKEA